jgi:hypothetical protein
MIQEQFIKLRTLHLIGTDMFEAKTVLEKKLHLSLTTRGIELRAMFVKESAIENLAHTEAIERRHGVRQERLADMKTWKPFALENDDTASCAGEQCRGGAASGAPANDRGIVDLVHARRAGYTWKHERQLRI